MMIVIYLMPNGSEEVTVNVLKFRTHFLFCFQMSRFCFVCLNLYIPSTIFQLYRDGSSWVEPVLSLDKCVLLKDHPAVTPVRLEPTALRSRVKHSTTEPLRSPSKLSRGMRFPIRWHFDKCRLIRACAASFEA